MKKLKGKLETKSADGDAPKEKKNEVVAVVDAINTSVTEMKTDQDALKAEIKSLKEDKSDAKTAEEVKSLKDSISKLEAVVARTEKGTDSEKNEALEVSKKTFDTFMRGKSDLRELEIGTKAMSTDVDPDGGYVVMPEMADFVAGRVFETSPLRTVARVIQGSSKSIEVMIDDDEAAATWVGEGASGGETNTPQIGLMEIPAHKIEADPRMTVEMTQDPAINMETWLQQKVASKFSRTENTAFVAGNGVSKPKGILAYDAWASAGVYERNKLEQVNLGATSTLTSDGFISLQGSLKEEYQGNAVWLMKRATYFDALKLKGNDQYFFGQTLLKDGVQSPTLLGKRVIFCDDMQAIGANNLAVAYGDFGVGYTVYDRIGLTVLRDPYTAKGFITYYTTKRTGGAVTNYDSIKIGKVAAA